jgi:hypothetical protein
MTKKEKWYEPEGDPVPEELKAPKIEIITPAPLYLPALWAGVLSTFQCQECGHCDADQDAMILHVITHLPENERESALDQLIKEKK